MYWEEKNCTKNRALRNTTDVYNSLFKLYYHSATCFAIFFVVWHITALPFLYNGKGHADIH